MCTSYCLMLAPFNQDFKTPDVCVMSLNFQHKKRPDFHKHASIIKV